MQYKTYATLKSEVLIETDTEAEDFIQASEVLAYFNDAINEAEAHIHKLGLEDDYFLSTAQFSLTNGLQYLTMPSDIYATKIRGLIYATTEKTYPIKGIKGPKKFEEMQDILMNSGGQPYYQYQILNASAANGHRIHLFPYSYETATNCITMYYIRNANEVTVDASVVDIPEFYSFIKAYVKYKIYDKEGSVKASDAKADLDKERLLMIETLTEMTPDYNNEIPPDLSIYEEMT